MLSIFFPASITRQECYLLPRDGVNSTYENGNFVSSSLLVSAQEAQSNHTTAPDEYLMRDLLWSLVEPAHLDLHSLDFEEEETHSHQGSHWG